MMTQKKLTVDSLATPPPEMRDIPKLSPSSTPAPAIPTETIHPNRDQRVIEGLRTHIVHIFAAYLQSDADGLLNDIRAAIDYVDALDGNSDNQERAYRSAAYPTN